MKWFKKNQRPKWRRYPNPYLLLHLQVYPQYLEEKDAGTYDPAKDPFCSLEYILTHPLKTFKDVEDELSGKQVGE